MLTNSFNSMVHALQRSTVSREYVEAIIQSLPDALFVLSPAGEIQQVNRAATRRTGHELKALLNQPVSALFKPANMDFRREFRDVETGLLSGSGDVIPVSVSTSAIRGKNGRLSGIACVVTDLSERTRLYHEAQEAIRSRDEFLSIASHEVKTPLTSLSLQLQILGREIRKNLDTARRESPGREPDHVSIPTRMLRIVSSSETQSEKLSNLLDELLDLTRIRLGRLTLARESFDLAHVAREVVERFKVEATQKRIPIWVDAPEPVIGQWDQLRIEQVISNLVSNAMKYGNGKPISVKVQMLEGGDQARLVVADQGMGIPAEMRERIFERFERAGVSGRKIAGLGLGLYICRQIVEAHGGSIRVETGPGPGSSFSVHLPLAEAAERVLKKASDG
jgi:PAS domain S-box-containing protein